MSEKYFMCCEKCFQRICKRSTKAAKLWMTLCSIECMNGLSRLEMQDSPALRTLELMDFVVTTDIPGYIAVNLKKGFVTTEEGTPFFCIEGLLHE